MSIGPEAGRLRGRVTGWVGALRQRRPWAAERSDGKPEQASKVLMRMPTLRSFAGGCRRGEVIDKRTHAIRRGSGYGTSVGWFVVTGGDPSRTRVAASASHQAVVTAGVGRGSRSVDAG